jgi:hypothetical protein
MQVKTIQAPRRNSHEQALSKIPWILYHGLDSKKQIGTLHLSKSKKMLLKKHTIKKVIS